LGKGALQTRVVDPLPSNYGMHSQVSQLQGAAQNNASRLWSLVAATSGRMGKIARARAHYSSPFKIEKKKTLKTGCQICVMMKIGGMRTNQFFFIFFSILFHSFHYYIIII
jgi:hypothetical protein